MLELRWLERKRKGIPRSPKVRVRQTETVLQYRALAGPNWNEPWGAPVWSGWRDVPTVTEQEAA